MSLLSSSNQQLTPVLHSLKITQSVQGIVLPLLWGTNRLQMILFGFWDFTDTEVSNSGGKGLGKNGTTYNYYAAILGGLCGKPLTGIGSIWAQNGRLNLQTESEVYTVPEGGGTFTVANAQQFANDFGVSIDANYDVQANDYGSPGPTTLTGVQQSPLQAVQGAPGAGQYTHNGTGTYTFPSAASGQAITINYSYSLYVLNETEDYNVPNSGPYEIVVTHQPDYRSDGGVINIFTGESMPASGSNPPPAGSYYVDRGNYFFNAADADTAVAISYSWRQSESNLDPSLSFAFTLIGGDRPQTPWSYLLSKHPSQALALPGVSMIGAPNMYLGSSGEMPSYNFECHGPCIFGGGIIDANLALVILDFLTDPVFGVGYGGIINGSLLGTAQAYWAANNFFVSPVLDSSRTGSSIIEEWCEAGNTAVFSSEGELKFIPYGDTTQVANGFTYTPNTTPLFDLDDDDFLPDGDEDPVKVGRTLWQDAFNQVKVQFDNRANNYNPCTVTERSRGSIARIGLRPEGQKSYDFLCTIDAATFSANIRLKRLVNIRKTYTVKISALRYGMLEQMDMVTLTDIKLGLVKEPVRIVELNEDENRVTTLTCEEFPWGTATATKYPKQLPVPPNTPSAMADPGDTTPFIFETTVQEANGLYNQLKIAATSTNPAWGGCKVWVSADNLAYEPAGTITAKGRLGATTTDLAAVADPDTTSTLGVDMTMSGAQLVSVAQTIADNLGTLCALFSTTGAIELIAYQNAALTAQGFYNLSYLRRGAYGSDIAAWPAGSKICRIDESVFVGQYQAQYVEQPLYLKFTSFNLAGQRTQDLSAVTAYEVILQGTTLGPPAPGVAQIDHNPLGAYTTSAGVSYITVGTFKMLLNNLTATCLSSGMVTVSPSVQPGQKYTVYYIDRAFAGGNITPIATQNPADYTGQSGVYVIGTIVTPAASSGGGTTPGPSGGGPYYPSNSLDSGATTTTNPGNAYDLDGTTYASVNGSVDAQNSNSDTPEPGGPQQPVGRGSGGSTTSYDWTYEPLTGVCTFLAFPDTTPTGETLSVSAAVLSTVTQTGSTSYDISASFDSGSTWVSMASGAGAVGQQTYSVAVPSGTDLMSVQVRVTASGDASETTAKAPAHAYCTVNVYNIAVS